MKILTALNDPLVADLLKEGKLGIIPTDTVYGLVCCATDLGAVTRLYKLKNRENKPGTVVAANIDQLVKIGIKRRYLKAVEYFWPNPISIEIPNQIAYLNQETGRQALRIPKDKNFHGLLMKTGPLLTTSANSPGKPPATTIDEAVKYFGNDVDFYVDSSDLSHRKPSTIIRIIDDAVEVLREGAVKIDEAGRIADEI